MGLYFESHVTIAPVFGEELARFRRLAQAHSFRVAELMMQKRRQDTAERSKYDTFCTGQHTDYTVLFDRTEALLRALKSEGFRVYRYKIEDTVLDSRHKDVLNAVLA